MADAVLAALKEIRAVARDRRSGAAELADRAAAAWLRFVRTSKAPPQVFERQLKSLAKATLAAQPAMAPLLNLACLVLRSVETVGVDRGRLKRRLARFQRELRTANQRIARRFARRLPPRAVVLTYSRSSTVETALLAAKRKIARVIVSEGRPQLEGRGLADKLARAGMRVTLVADAALPGKVREADAVVVGADAIALGRYVNKIGTRVLQREALALGKPFYVLADNSKILPAESARRVGKYVARTFERIPLARGVTVLTEHGPLSHRRYAGATRKT